MLAIFLYMLYSYLSFGVDWSALPIFRAISAPALISLPMLRAKDPKVRRARVCETVAGLVLQETQVTNAAPWLL